MRWIRPLGFGHAQQHFAKVYLGEIRQVARDYVFAFATHNKRTFPICILGLEDGSNLFLSPDDQWGNTYIPATLRTYPFSFKYDPKQRPILCIDQESGLLTAEKSGEPFFSDTGDLAPALHQIFQLLNQVQNSKIATDRASEALKKKGLLTPWTQSINTENGVKTVKGLYCVDEGALERLETIDLKVLLRLGALELAFLQIFSMQNLDKLSKLHKPRQEPQYQVDSSDDDYIHFDALL
jgi:hypothetical protein